MLQRHGEKVAIYKPRREASEETGPANSLILNFWPPELGENDSCLNLQSGVFCYGSLSSPTHRGRFICLSQESGRPMWAGAPPCSFPGSQFLQSTFCSPGPHMPRPAPWPAAPSVRCRTVSRATGRVADSYLPTDSILLQTCFDCRQLC